MNPSAKEQIKQYARSVAELFSLMIQERHQEFRKRIYDAKSFVFGSTSATRRILLSDAILDEFSLGTVPETKRVPNSHLSLLAMADSWHRLGIRPYEHMVCQTPPFRLWLGITEYCFMNSDVLESAIHAALFSKEFRGDDLSVCESICVFYVEMYSFMRLRKDGRSALSLVAWKDIDFASKIHLGFLQIVSRMQQRSVHG